MQNFLELALVLGWQGQGIKIECNRFAEADDEDAFAMLRDEVCAVNDAPMNVVTQLLGQCAADNFKGAALVMRLQVLYIFQQEGARALGRDDARHVEEQRPLGFTGEAVCFAKRIFLRDAGNRKRLTGKTGQLYVVVRNLGSVNLGNVAVDQMPVPEIVGIGFLCIAVPLAGEHATPLYLLERLAEAAYAREQVDEIECAFRAALPEWQQLLQCVGQISGRVRLSCFPPADRANTDT